MDGAKLFFSWCIGALMGGAIVLTVGLGGNWTVPREGAETIEASPTQDEELDLLGTLVKQNETPTTTPTKTPRPTSTPDPRITSTPLPTEVPLCGTGADICQKRQPTPGPTATVTAIPECDDPAVEAGDLCHDRNA